MIFNTAHSIGKDPEHKTNNDKQNHCHKVPKLIYGQEQAETCAMITHYKGKCAVKSGTYEELEPYYVSLLNHHLYAKIQ